MGHDVEDVFAREPTLLVEQDYLKAPARCILQQVLKSGRLADSGEPSQVGQSRERVPLGTLGEGVFGLTQAHFLLRFGLGQHDADGLGLGVGQVREVADHLEELVAGGGVV